MYQFYSDELRNILSIEMKGKKSIAREILKEEVKRASETNDRIVVSKKEPYSYQISLYAKENGLDITYVNENACELYVGRTPSRNVIRSAVLDFTKEIISSKTLNDAEKAAIIIRELQKEASIYSLKTIIIDGLICNEYVTYLVKEILKEQKYVVK